MAWAVAPSFVVPAKAGTHGAAGEAIGRKWPRCSTLRRFALMVACRAGGTVDPGLRRGDKREMARGDAENAETSFLLRASRASACPTASAIRKGFAMCACRSA